MVGPTKSNQKTHPNSLHSVLELHAGLNPIHGTAYSVPTPNVKKVLILAGDLRVATHPTSPGDD